MSLSTDTIDRIDRLKNQLELRSRDAVVARIVRQSLLTHDPETFLQRAVDPCAVHRRISPIVADELVDYIRTVQSRFRNIGYGPAFEMILAKVVADRGEFESDAKAVA